MVRIAAESEPASGSVIAIAAQRPSKRCSCSSLATEAIAELPSPWRGIESSSPTSPQQSSMIPKHGGEVGAVAVRGVLGGAGVAPHAGGAGATGVAAGVHAVDQRGEHVELLGVLVLGEVVLARDRAEDLGRDLVGLADERAELLGYLEIDHQTSRAPSISPTARRSRYQRSTGCSLT